ncbi:subclass B1 metallo-beta-lactamase [Hymenobacter weizhouensis]|uniref:subclass B1 metallo-beta-lactamase n=1 Tax=Hymenobacter sp. YIM 151500-1 TaxID=2987689 RepID=UPI0022260C0E|nr:subclass B1 metallo-beta-lactamase [Hymenobacter sp. YIM 151500-1]UYZ62638.1 subclass B1 metallo-beta-lactamase [Hymenobacter sp. YIM 151500-1]
MFRSAWCRRSWLCCLVLLTWGLAAVAGPVPELPRLRVRPVAKDIFVHTSYHLYPGTAVPVSANGLVVRTAQGIILVDAGWGPDYTEQLLRWVADSLRQRVRLVVLTHAHDDRAGGLAVLRARGIRVYSTPATAQRLHAQFLGAARPTPALKPYTLIRAGRTRLELFFPGPAHAPDNLVAWLPRRKVLFGGCLVREASATSLGNLDEANLKQWPAALQQLQRRYPQARLVVPGHGAWADASLLQHTRVLLREAGRRKSPTALRE